MRYLIAPEEDRNQSLCMLLIMAANPAQTLAIFSEFQEPQSYNIVLYSLELFSFQSILPSPALEALKSSSATLVWCNL